MSKLGLHYLLEKIDGTLKCDEKRAKPESVSAGSLFHHHQCGKVPTPFESHHHLPRTVQTAKYRRPS